MLYLQYCYIGVSRSFAGGGGVANPLVGEGEAPEFHFIEFSRILHEIKRFLVTRSAGGGGGCDGLPCQLSRDRQVSHQRSI